MSELAVPSGYFVPPHIHDEDDETLYILESELTLLSGDGETKAGPGCCVLLPHGKAHGFRNNTGSTVRFLTIVQNGRQIVEMFRHLDRATRSTLRGLTPDDIGAISRHYGVHMV